MEKILENFVIKKASCSCGKEWNYFEGHDKIGIPEDIDKKWSGVNKIHSCADLDVYQQKIILYYHRKK
ncbi:MAG: hypothetical protein KGI08_00330 [Thaumarchaeota archaeon]|nr:hypothetical protein [Nitrososphaerota archaeon]